MQHKIKNKMNKKKKRLLIAVSILVIIIISLIISINEIKRAEQTENVPYKITSAKELLEYYKCSNITIKDSDEEMFATDIYLTFGEDLWIEEKSNESYYEAIALYLTEILEYQSYRMIDHTRELVIAIIANSNEKKIEKMYINGQLGYFEKEQTKQVIEKYQKIEISQIEIQAIEIQDYIQNNWKADSISLGTLDSRFKGYDIYFEEGIELRTLGGRVYNIIFTDKYKGNIINNLKVNSEKEKIIQTLGEPTFENENVFGYKSDEIYVFFSENQVSVYRRENEYKTEEFLKIWEEFQEKKDAKNFVNKLTNIWKDHNEYYYDSEIIHLEYALRGIQIQFNVSAENGIILYENYEGELSGGVTLDNISVENLPKHVYIHENDLVFQKEEERVDSKIRYTSEEYMNQVDDNYFLEEANGTFCFNNKESNLFYLEYQYVVDKGIREIKFISKDGKNPNSELIRHVQIYTYGWMDDEQFVYSVSGEGIYCYNAKTRKLTTITTGYDKYEIKKIEEDTIFYDDTNIKLK